jgi:hypothetical protein
LLRFWVQVPFDAHLIHLSKQYPKQGTTKKRGFREEAAFFDAIDVGDVVFMTLMAFIISISLFGCHFLM